MKKLQPDETGHIVVEGRWKGSDYIELPNCECCGRGQTFYLSFLPEEWRGRRIVLFARLAKGDK